VLIRPALAIPGRASDVALAAALPFLAVELAMRLVASELSRSVHVLAERGSLPQPR